MMMTGPTIAETHPAMTLLRAHWEGLRRGRQVPLRSEVDPRRIEPALHHAFILERVAPQVARFRVAGQHLTDVIGMDPRGMPLTTLFAAAARDQAGQALEQVFKGPEAIEIALDAADRPVAAGRILLLPLRSDLGDISRAIGCLVAAESLRAAPPRFRIRDILAMPVAAGRPLSAGSPPLPPAQALAPALAESASDFDAAPLRSHLRLVVSN